MRDHLERYSKSLMCSVMGVSRWGFNKWLKCAVSAREQRKALYIERVKETYAEFEAAYGAPRITQELNELGYPCSENYIAKLMAEQGLRALSLIHI